MSYGTVRKKLAEQREQVPEIDPKRCAANGCPCRGSCSSDGKTFVCSAHDAAAETHKWPRVTESLIEHKWLLDLLDELKTMHTQHQDWREFAIRFWTEDAQLRPDAKEQFQPYELRMRSEVLYRCGLVKRPGPRLPKPILVRGNAAASLGART